MIILGIDPGLATLGYGVIEVVNDKRRLIQFGTLTTPAGQPMPQRLELFFSKNITTGMAVSAARGVALVAVVQRTDNLYEYTPMQIKQAVTGYGGADKHQVQQMVRMLLNMKEIARPDDAADALAVALTHANSMHMKKMFKIQ